MHEMRCNDDVKVSQREQLVIPTSHKYVVCRLVRTRAAMISSGSSRGKEGLLEGNRIPLRFVGFESDAEERPLVSDEAARTGRLRGL